MFSSRMFLINLNKINHSTDLSPVAIGKSPSTIVLYVAWLADNVPAHQAFICQVDVCIRRSQLGWLDQLCQDSSCFAVEEWMRYVCSLWS